MSYPLLIALASMQSGSMHKRNLHKITPLSTAKKSAVSSGSIGTLSAQSSSYPKTWLNIFAKVATSSKA